MKKLLYILGLLLLLAASYYILRPKVPERKPLLELDKDELGDTSQDKKPIKVVEPKRTGLVHTSEELKKMQHHEGKLAATEVFSDTEVGKSLSTLMKLIRDLDEPSSERGAKAWEQINKLNKRPDETFSEIRQGLSKIEDSDETKKQFLLQYASRLDVDKEQKLEMLSEQLMESVISARFSDNIQAQVTPSIILETYIRTSNDRNMTEDLLVKALLISTKQIQRTLINSFRIADLNRANELAEIYNIEN